MQLTEHDAGNHHVIREIDERRIRIDNDYFESSLVVGARLLEPDWPVNSLDQLDDDIIGPLLELEPELVVIGAGTRQQILPPDRQLPFIRRGIGVECMTLHAACRTFNVLMSENRRALAALILPKSP